MKKIDDLIDICEKADSPEMNKHHMDRVLTSEYLQIKAQFVQSAYDWFLPLLNAIKNRSIYDVSGYEEEMLTCGYCGARGDNNYNPPKIHKPDCDAILLGLVK